ncbi:MAG: Stealth CR1 domain-containing protein [Bacteroidales bacterium]|nr:Stealth CR1 domain-containing protein [Bacteroidales bacterium]
MDIDIIIPWVNGNDPEWIKEFNKYCKDEKSIIDSSNVRYRDNGLLKYWFRGIEKFAPWVRKVHFVTCGQKTTWLNTNAPKLHCVEHSHYIPGQYLPVFSSHPIELMMHKIPDLSEHFIYFNDDFFLTAPVSKDFFFKNGLPRDAAVFNAISVGEMMGHIQLNNITEINKHFNKYSVIKHHCTKFINPIYGFDLLRTIMLMPWPKFTGFNIYHFAQPYTKTLLYEVWEKCEDMLNNTMNSRFRSKNDVNQWLFQYWNMCSGNFYPTKLIKKRKYYSLKDDINIITNVIKKQKYKEIVINDEYCNDYESRIIKIQNAFESILPEKSIYEL